MSIEVTDSTDGDVTTFMVPPGGVIVMTPGPGRAASETVIDAPAPRPPGFRATAEFRHAAEAISERLAAATRASAVGAAA